MFISCLTCFRFQASLRGTFCRLIRETFGLKQANVWGRTGIVAKIMQSVAFGMYSTISKCRFYLVHITKRQTSLRRRESLWLLGCRFVSFSVVHIVINAIWNHVCALVNDVMGKKNLRTPIKWRVIGNEIVTRHHVIVSTLLKQTAVYSKMSLYILQVVVQNVQRVVSAS